ncbi:unnamed protein product [Rotaria sp. Silwood2]|nr:unnamed protein product [Rotaria sp. Silwood2]
MVITNLDTILISLTDFYSNPNYDSSLLIEELSRSISLSSSTTILHKLSIVHSHISLLISFCKINLIRTLVDSDTIHALLRLILRLTRNYKYVQQFVEKGGIKAILNLTEISAFQGYTSLIILIFRHIMEDKKNLCLTMEKSIRQALIDNHSVQYDSHEFNLILRKLSPVITRSSDIFLEVVSNVLQLLPTSFMTENEYYTQTNIQMNSLILHVRPETNQITNYDQIGELAEHLLDDLLNFLLINDDNNKKRLLTKSTILYILSELINSYSNMDKFLSTKTFLEI